MCFSSYVGAMLCIEASRRLIKPTHLSAERFCGIRFAESRSINFQWIPLDSQCISMHFNGFHWTFNGFHWIPVDFIGFQSIPLDSCRWSPMDPIGFECIRRDANGFQWIPVDVNGFHWIPMNPNGSQWMLLDSSVIPIDPQLIPIGVR